MSTYIESRAIELANYTIQHKSPVRNTAKRFGVSKSTVFRDLTVVLPQVNSLLARQAAEVMRENFGVKHVRGGQATKRRYGK